MAESIRRPSATASSPRPVLASRSASGKPAPVPNDGCRQRNITSTSEYRHRRHQRHSHHQNREMLREVHANEANVTNPPRASTGPVRRQGHHRTSRGEKVGMETRGTEKDEPRFTNRSRRARKKHKTSCLGVWAAFRPQATTQTISTHARCLKLTLLYLLRA